MIDQVVDWEQFDWTPINLGKFVIDCDIVRRSEVVPNSLSFPEIPGTDCQIHRECGVIVVLG